MESLSDAETVRDRGPHTEPEESKEALELTKRMTVHAVRNALDIRICLASRNCIQGTFYHRYSSRRDKRNVQLELEQRRLSLGAQLERVPRLVTKREQAAVDVVLAEEDGAEEADEGPALRTGKQ